MSDPSIHTSISLLMFLDAFQSKFQTSVHFTLNTPARTSLMELNIVQGDFLNFEFNFTQNETQRSQVSHSGGYGVDAGSSPKPGKKHTPYPYFPAGPCEGEMLLTSLAHWGWFLLEEKKKKILDFLGCFFLFVCFCCISNPGPTFTMSPDWTCKLLVQPFSFSLLPLSSPFPGIGTLPAFDNNRPLFRIHHHPIPPSTFT